MKRSQYSGYVIVLAVLLINLLFSSGWLFNDPIGEAIAINMSPDMLEKLAAYHSNIISASENVTSSLFTIQISSFIVVGFLIRQKYDDSSKWSSAEMLLLLLFLMSGLFSLYFGYVARIQLLQIISVNRLDFNSVQRTLGRQALLVSVSGTAAIAAAGVWFAYNQAKGSR